MKRFTKYILTLLLATTSLVAQGSKPTLAVNIIVSGMRSDDLTCYAENFGEEGFSRLMGGGVVFTECYADFLPTSSAVSLASIATGTQPATHGISTTRWYERSVRNTPVDLCRTAVTNDNPAPQGILRGYTTAHFNAQTLAEAVIASGEESHAISLAHDPLSAMMLSGGKGECYWLDEDGNWATADCYAEVLPSWVKAHNDIGFNAIYVRDSWLARFSSASYRNSRHSDLRIYNPDSKGSRRESSKQKGDSAEAKMREQLMLTPAGNSAMLEFAKKALNRLLDPRYDKGVRVLNICLDTPRHIVEKYGPDSMEWEDMLYCLDLSLAEFMTHLLAQVKSERDIVVTLCSDHGTSPTSPHAERSATAKGATAKSVTSSATASKGAERFNVRQAEVILNAFLSARHGQQNWILGCHDRGIYLDHELIYKQGKSLAQIQHEVATFALQLRGVASAITATTLCGGAFPSGVQHIVQNGFSPRRSGDVILTLLPRRIESDSKRVSATGSPYNYDRHLPLIIYGGGIKPATVRTRTDITSLAPSLALLLGVERPDCSDAPVLKQVIDTLEQ
ncbi:MAG: alkaline phosphatase family protein [Alistipes sp.]|nr:alkaline phosphatase family protein [Alistipes sp.]